MGQWGYAFAALSGGQCFGARYPPASPADSVKAASECALACADDPTLRCGNDIAVLDATRYSVYHLDGLARATYVARCARDGLALTLRVVSKTALNLKSGRRTAFADVTAAF